MKRLLAHIRRRRRHIEETVEAATEEGVDADRKRVGAEPELPECSSPRLALLVQDAAGPAAYQLHTFEDAPSAAAFIQFWFPPRFEHGIRAFWTAHKEPAWQADSNGRRPAEAVIMIRDEDRRDIVYPFSCSDMGQARSWIATEVTRGLDLRLVLLYWAVPVRIEANGFGAVLLSPSEPPAGRDRDGAEAGFEAEPALLESEEEVEDTGVVAELIDFEVEEPAVDAPLNAVKLAEAQAEWREEVGMVDLEPVKEPAADAPLDMLALEEDHAEPRGEAESAAPKPVEEPAAAATLDMLALEEDHAEPRDGAEMAALELAEEPAAVTWLDALTLEEDHAEPREEAGAAALEPVEEPAADATLDMLTLEEAHTELEEEAESVDLEPVERDGDQNEVVEAEEMAEVPVEDEEAAERFVEEDAPRVAEDGDTVDESAWGLGEIPSELANLLKVRRWRQSEEPFKGFGSPRGKF